MIDIYINKNIFKLRESCFICNLESMDIVEVDRVKSLNITKKLTSVCPHLNYSKQSNNLLNKLLMKKIF